MPTSSPILISRRRAEPCIVNGSPDTTSSAFDDDVLDQRAVDAQAFVFQAAGAGFAPDGDALLLGAIGLHHDRFAVTALPDDRDVVLGDDHRATASGPRRTFAARFRVG